jgi:hypothetical protein
MASVTKLMRMAMCFVRYDAACMVFLKQVSSHKISSPSDSTKPVTTKARSHQGTGDTTGALVVDDFGVKYINKADVEHLMSVLKQDYKVETDWEGTRYLGLTLDWDYIKREVHLSVLLPC